MGHNSSKWIRDPYQPRNDMTDKAPELNDRVPKDKRIALVQHAANELIALATKLGCTVSADRGLIENRVVVHDRVELLASLGETLNRNSTFGKFGLPAGGFHTGGLATLRPDEIPAVLTLGVVFIDGDPINKERFDQAMARSREGIKPMPSLFAGTFEDQPVDMERRNLLIDRARSIVQAGGVVRWTDDAKGFRWWPRYDTTRPGEIYGDVPDSKGHVFYTNADKDRPAVICDANHEVVLALCKLCGKAEGELDDKPCAGKQVDQ